MHHHSFRWRGLACAAVLAAAPSAVHAGIFAAKAPAAPPPAGTDAVMAQVEEAFTRVAENAFPAVVVITNKRVDRRPVYPANALPPEFRYFFGIPEGPEETSPAPQAGKARPMPVGKGSGVVIRGEGYILTNYHVIEDADALEVKLHDGRVFDNARDKTEVVVVGLDRETDLAVLKIGGGKLNDLPLLPFADSGKVKVGQFAIAVGAPFNLDYSVSVGHVSQKGRYDVNINTYENYIQTDASINPGNSGGPLLNIRGEIIGINEFIVTGGPQNRGNIGIGFAIASNLVRQVADNLVEKGVVARPWLGISMQALSEELKTQFKVRDGILVNEAIKDDPAEKAGIRAGDVIIRVGATPVYTPHDLQFAVLGYKPGDTIPVTVNRGGKTLEFKVVARLRNNRDAAANPAEASEALGRLGLNLEDGKDGIKVQSVIQGSPAAAAQLRKGDVILEVNRQSVKTVPEFLAAMAAADSDTLVLYIDRKGAKFFVPVTPAGGKDGK